MQPLEESLTVWPDGYALLFASERQPLFLTLSRKERLSLWLRVNGKLKLLDSLTRINPTTFKWFKHRGVRWNVSDGEVKKVLFALGFATRVVGAFAHAPEGVMALKAKPYICEGEELIATRYLYAGTLVINPYAVLTNPPGTPPPYSKLMPWRSCPPQERISRTPEAVLFAFDLAGKPRIVDGVLVDRWWYDSSHGGNMLGRSYARVSWRMSGVGVPWWREHRGADRWPATAEGIRYAASLFSFLGFNPAPAYAALEAGKKEVARIIHEHK